MSTVAPGGMSTNVEYTLRPSSISAWRAAGWPPMRAASALERAVDRHERAVRAPRQAHRVAHHVVGVALGRRLVLEREAEGALHLARLGVPPHDVLLAALEEQVDLVPAALVVVTMTPSPFSTTSAAIPVRRRNGRSPRRLERDEHDVAAVDDRVEHSTEAAGAGEVGGGEAPEGRLADVVEHLEPALVVVLVLDVLAPLRRKSSIVVRGERSARPGPGPRRPGPSPRPDPRGRR